MGIALSEDEAWAFLDSALTGIVTTLRRDGFPVTLPVWFVVLGREVYFRTPAGSSKVARIRADPRAAFLVESGDRWRDLRAVSFSATARLVTDEARRAEVFAARAAKYADRGTGDQRTLPEATVRHYAGDSAIVALAPVGRLISWDNQKLRLTRHHDNP
jgi:PPOX class probable F420-dependent enzyme